jgi:hypothetical protein
MRISELINRLDSYERFYNGYDLQKSLGYYHASFLDLSNYGYTCKVIYEYKHPARYFLVGKYLIFRDKQPIAIQTTPYLEEASGIKWIDEDAYEKTRNHIDNLHLTTPEEPDWVDLDEEWSETYKVPSIKNLIAGVHTKAIYLGKEYTVDWDNRQFIDECTLEFPDQVVPLKEISANNLIPISQLSFPVLLNV